MRRSSERLIDVLVLAMLLGFAWLMRDQQPGLAGVIVAASIQFWMAKNATDPQTSLEEKAALAAAEVLRVAREQIAQEKKTPSPVEIVGQSDAVDVDVVTKPSTNGDD